MTVVTFLLSICAALMLAVGAYKWTQQGAVIALPYVIWGTVAFALILWNRRPKGDS
jgi:tryptophan-rich sensory protein